MMIITGTHLLPVQTIGHQHLPELLEHVVRHVLVTPFPADDNTSSIVEDWEPPTPQHEGIVLMGPRNQPPVLVRGGPTSGDLRNLQV